MTPAEIMSTANGFCIKGNVGFSNVVALRNQGEKILSQRSADDCLFIIDFSSMKEDDASIFSLLFCWMRLAALRKYKLQFVNASSSLQCMSKMFGLDGIWNESFLMIL